MPNDIPGGRPQNVGLHVIKRIVPAVTVIAWLVAGIFAITTNLQCQVDELPQGFEPPTEYGVEKALDQPEELPDTGVAEIVETIAQRLVGETGSSSRWGSGWLDLATTTDFKENDRLRLKIGGTAAKTLVRLLPKGLSPDSPQGIIGGVLNVPEDRVVEVTLKTDQKGIIQISVHGGPNPWDSYPLGGSNGPATIENIELIRQNN